MKERLIKFYTFGVSRPTLDKIQACIRIIEASSSGVKRNNGYRNVLYSVRCKMN
ncbi:MAG: hypothetical protein ACK5KT_01170 [Dysgonomonas sp.]